MGRYHLLWYIVLFVLSQGVVTSRVAAVSPGVYLSRDNPLSGLFRQDPRMEFGENLERHMATVSIMMALLALGVAVLTLVWCQRLSGSVTRLRTNISNADARERLAELARESQSLHARVDHLRQCWQADTGKLEPVIRQLENRLVELEQGHNSLGAVSKDLDSLRDFRSQIESVVRQLENRIVELEQSYSRLGTLSRDLDSLRDFRNQVERIHAGIQRAFNGTLAGTSSAIVRDEESPQVAG